MSKPEAVICAPVRTAIGTYNGSLKTHARDRTRGGSHQANAAEGMSRRREDQRSSHGQCDPGRQ